MLIDGLIVLLVGMGLLALSVKAMWASEACDTGVKSAMMFWCVAAPMAAVGIVLMAVGCDVAYVSIEGLAQVSYVKSVAPATG